MPRKRQIDPSIWTDRDFIRLTLSQRLLFIGLFSQADDEGLIESDYQYLKALIFPCDNWTKKDYERDLRACATCGIWAGYGRKKAQKVALVVEYSAGGMRFLWLPKWFRYQVIDHPTASKLPRPNKILIDKFPEYYIGWRKYFSEDSQSPLGETLRALETGNSLLYKGAMEGLSSSLNDTEKPDEDPLWSYRCAVGFGRVCETPHLKTKQKWFRDLARQGVSRRAIEEAAMDPKYANWGFFEIVDDLKEIHLNGGQRDGRKRGTDRATLNPGAKAVLGHFALRHGELDEKDRARIAERERREGEGKGGGAAEDRGDGDDAAQVDKVPGPEKV